jgi:hypothetical protein
MAAQAEKSRYRMLRVPDPAYLMLRAKQGVRPGALSRQSRAKVVGQRFLLVNGWPKDGSAKAWGVVRIEPGSAFRDGPTAIKELGAKLDEPTRREFAGESGQVWFHPLAVVEAYKEPLPVASRAQASRGAVDKGAADDALAMLAALGRELKLSEFGEGGRKTEALLLVSGAIEREVARRNEANPDDLLGQVQFVIKGLREHVSAAVWSTAYKNKLPDSAFLYVAPGGEKDSEGKTVPRARRYFPVRDDKGKLDIPHLRNAIARIPQSTAPGLTEQKIRDLQDKARRLLEEARKNTAVNRVQAGDSVAKGSPAPLTDLDEVLSWAADVLKDGVAVEPKHSGPTVAVQRDSDGVVALFLDGTKVEQTEHLPSLSKAADALDRPALMVGGLVGHDGDAKMLVREVLHWGDTDVTDRPWDERRPFRKRALRGIQGDAFVDAPSRVVYTEQELRDASRWAGLEPGSLGAVLKSVNGTCDSAGQAMDAMEFLATRGVDAVVLDHQIKKDAPARVYTCGVGPVDNPDDWQHTTEVRGKHYVTIGKTFASNITAEPGDVLRIEATELLLDTREPRNLTWFAPTVVEKTDSQPMKPADVERLVRPDEINKHFVIKAKDGEYERYVFGLVLEPNDGDGGNPFAPDLQKDTYSAEEIWTAWWNYAVDSRKQGLLHKKAVSVKGMVLLDNYVVPDDMTVNGQHFRKGSWVMGAHVKDDALWKSVLDGTYNGWSIQGSAIRELMRRAA